MTRSQAMQVGGTARSVNSEKIWLAGFPIFDKNVEFMIGKVYDEHMENTSPPKLFDLKRTAMFRERSGRTKVEDADFLARMAAQTIAERLAVTQRQFEKCLDLGSPGDTLEQAIRELPNVSGFASLDLTGTHLYRPSDDLGLEPQSCTLITSLFHLHRSNDLPGVLSQVRRSLKPDGLFLGCLPAGQTLQELRHSLLVAESEISGNASLRVDPFGQTRQYGDLLQRADFALPVADSETLTIRYDNMYDLIGDIRAMGANAAFVDKAPLPHKEMFHRAAQIYQEQFSDEDGRIRATVELVFLSGWAPDKSQQKPLKPGSAKNLMKDYL